MSKGTWIAALAACAVLVGGTVAQAEPIRFNNPVGEDHFVWCGDPGDPEITLDIVLSPEQQPGMPDSRSRVNQQVESNNGRITGPSTIDTWTQGSGSPDSYWMKSLAEGTIIPAVDSNWKNGTAYYYYDGAQWEPYLPPLGEAYFVGFRFDLSDNGIEDWQYGWAEVIRGGGELLPQQLDVLAWGYETEVGVPIIAGIPEPATLALLAMGAAGILRRRR